MIASKWAIAVAAAIAAVPATLAAQEKPPIAAHKLRGDIYRVDGGTSNAGFIVGKDGVLLFDPQRTEPEAQKQIAAIAAITPKPIKAIIVSHSDPDHLGGLPAYSKDVEIIAHENTNATIRVAAAEAEAGGPFFGPLYKKVASERMPGRTISGSERITIAGIPAQILFVAPAHSSGDLILYLPKQKTVFAGDVILTSFGRFPIIHVGGSSAGWIETMKTILALDADIYVPGHGKIETRAHLQKRLADVIERRAQIKAMVDKRASLDEINAALPPEIGNPVFPSFNETTYLELTKGWPEAVAPWANVAKKKTGGADHAH